MHYSLRLLLVLGLNAISCFLIAQVQIDSSFAFQSDPSKDYSIYIPSGYEDGKSIAAFLALHPLNTSNWDGRRWCEEISDFAETNTVILICPDGGADGAIDDPIDTAFTTVMIDSAMAWYSISPDSLYAMGFSWGGKTAYTYGLNHVNKFAGFMPIGAATSVSDIIGISDQSMNKPFYIIHGSNDNPNTRYYPMIERLESEGAIVESLLMPGVGHTIWFPNQVQILSDGFTWLKENSTSIVNVEDHITDAPNPILTKENYHSDVPLLFNDDVSGVATIYSLDGMLIYKGTTHDTKAPKQNGVYIVTVGQSSQKFIVTQ